jgi:hypothetical protein
VPPSLPADRLESLLAILPDAELANLLAGFDGEAERIGPAEQFVLAVTAVPRYATRAHALHTRATFDTLMGELEGRCAVVAAACMEVRASPALRRALAWVLRAGNHLNGGTARGGAWGFRLDSLGTLGNVKAADGATLLHFLARQLAADEWDGRCGGGVLGKLAEQLPTLEEAAARPWKEHLADGSALARRVDQIGALLESERGTPFAAALAPFHAAATARGAELAAKDKAASAECAQLVQWLAEDDPEAVFHRLRGFVCDLQRAARENGAREEAEARRRKHAEEAGARAAERREHDLATRGDAASGGGGLKGLVDGMMAHPAVQKAPAPTGGGEAVERALREGIARIRVAQGVRATLSGRSGWDDEDDDAWDD